MHDAIDSERAERAPDVASDSYGCVLQIGGMDCASCVERVERAVREVPGVEDARADVMSGRLRLALNERASSVELERALRRAGYPVQAVVRVDGGYRWDDAASPAEATPWWRGPLLYTLLAGVFWFAALLGSWVFESTSALIVFSALSVAAGGRYVLPAGLRALTRGALDMHFLMSAAAIGAFFIGEYLEGASVLFLYSIAELLESRSMDRARDAVRGMMDLAPPHATRLRGGEEARVPVEALTLGDRVIVLPGERVPTDGVIQRGRSSLDQAAITGESLPQPKAPGDAIFAGTLNGEGALEFEVTALAHDTTLARILHAMEEAQGSRSETQRFVDRFARVYTPAVVVLTLLVAVIPPLVLGAEWSTWIYRALVLLVVSCPCALVIATPVTMVAALGGAARAGILVKGGRHLEAAARVKHVALDKTGTLTHGVLVIDAVMPATGVSEDALLAYAALAEQESEHPIARAILAETRARDIAAPWRDRVETRALPGFGVETIFQEGRVLVGNPRLFQERGAWGAELQAMLTKSEQRGATLVIVARADAETTALDADTAPIRVLGAVALRDTLRQDAAGALRELRALGVERFTMLTGDGSSAAAMIAEELAQAGAPLDVVRAGLLPEEKLGAVRQAEADDGPLAMVGDGINDAPALAAATLGVAMGRSGADVALEIADVVLVGDAFHRLPTLRRFALRARAILRWNIAIALGLKLVFIVLAMAGIASLWLAVLADTGATLIVVANGLRARYLPSKSAETPND